jgi:hypothetical protein
VAASYVGNMWSSLQELDDRGGVNIVTNEDAVGEAIVAFLLTRKGEDPFAPEYGLDIDIFSNLNDFDADIWGFYVQEQLKQQIVGLNALNVRSTVEPVDGRIVVNIDYSTDMSNARNTLTFPYHTYTGTQSGDANIADFIESIALNGNRFRGLDPT